MHRYLPQPPLLNKPTITQLHKTGQLNLNTHTHACTHARTHARTHTHTHTHTQGKMTNTTKMKYSVRTGVSPSDLPHITRATVRTNTCFPLPIRLNYIHKIAQLAVSTHFAKTNTAHSMCYVCKLHTLFYCTQYVLCMQTSHFVLLHTVCVMYANFTLCFTAHSMCYVCKLHTAYAHST